MASTIETVRPGTRDRILDSAFSAVATHGLARLTVDDVARLAGLSRQTVYRYFDSKDALIQALVYREEETFIEGVRAAHARHDRLEDAMREAILYCLTAAREHPLLDRLLASEADALVPVLTIHGGGLLARARAVIEELAAGWGLRSELVHRSADVSVRAMVSYVLTPSEDDPEDIAGELARILVSALEVREEDVR
ncbi:MAG TPA: TetR family transcriptional regulator [Actinomycetota bacterium]|nr:TetR family transcriptional regulator [Actinomycetota bacterium]